MKKFLMAALSTALLISAAGCSNQTKEEPKVTALSVMDTVNSKNIVNSESDMRLWYQVNPALFTDRATGAAGTISSILTDIEYLSDGDMETTNDLNMSGILLTNLFAVDDQNAPKDFVTIDPNLGIDDDLSSLCNRGASLNLPVMVSLEIGYISQENADFKAMCDLVNQNPDHEDLFSLNPDLFDMFFIEKDHGGQDGWTQIGTTAYYYRSLPQTSIPKLNMGNINVRVQLQTGLRHLINLGVSGFYIPDFDAVFGENQEQGAEFMTWMSESVQEMNPNAKVVYSYTNWNDALAPIPAYSACKEGEGAQGMIGKAVTGAIPAKDLGLWLESAGNQSNGMNASFINSDQNSLDLLKVSSRLPQYKMALALQIMTSGQIFILSGDELGLTSEQTDLIVDAIEMPKEDEEENTDFETKGQEIDLEFGSLSEQKADGNSILNFVQQAIKLRNSWLAISEGTTTCLQDLSTDQVLVLDKRQSNSEAVLVFNLSSKEATVDLSSVKINSLPAELGGELLTGTSPVTLENNILTLPANSMALLK